MLKAISPIDGRYAKTTRSLSDFFSEFALIKYRVFVEVKYFEAMCMENLPQLNAALPHLPLLVSIIDNFNEADAQKIKEIEAITNHDVKAVEYFIKEKLENTPLEPFREFIHFGLTSQDINNTAQPLALLECSIKVIYPAIEKLIEVLDQKAVAWMHTPLLAHTHGQPASPTTIGKEIKVFIERIKGQYQILKETPITAKFGGATGNFNAHHIAYPAVDWHDFGDRFVSTLGLHRIKWTTQIEPYDFLAAYCHTLIRINSILIDFCRDVWMYISMQFIKQRAVANEVGSSAMPHKVNPIDFENAEGNLGLANAIFDHFALKLPVSRLQRDLTDSTVLRNLGVPIAHTLISINSIHRGLTKIDINESVLTSSLEANWAVVAEAIQTILRREGIKNSYELLKDLTRGKMEITKSDIQSFVTGLPIGENIKEELLNITPQNYIGQFPKD